MRALFVATPASEFNVLAPAAIALRSAGHEVAFVSAERMRSSVERLGAAFFPSGPESPSALRAFKERMQAATSAKERVALARGVLHAGIGVEAALPVVVESASRWSADVVVRDQIAFSGCLAAEKLGIPHAVVDNWAVGGAHYERAAIMAPLNEWRARLGLPADPELAMLERFLVLVPFPRSFRDPAERTPATAHNLQPGLFTSSGAEPLPDWFATLPERPIVHLTLGTFFNVTDTALRTEAATIEAAASLPVNLILTIGQARDPADLGPLPENVRAVRFLSHNALLPRCALVISHGGAGTVTSALWHGLPQLVLPLAADQFDNGALVERLGAGAQLAEDARTAARIAQTMQRLLEEPRFAAAAAAVRAEMSELPPSSAAVDLLERLVATGRPVLAPK